MQPFNVLISNVPVTGTPEVLVQTTVYAKNALCAAVLAEHDLGVSELDASTLEVVVVPFAK